MKKTLMTLAAVLFLWQQLPSQSVKLIPDPGFVPYEMYYISSIDLTTGSSDVLFFGYRLADENNDYSNVWVSIEFEMTMQSPALGIDEPTTVLKIETDPFRMLADIRIDNRDLNMETSEIFDMASNPVDLGGKIHVVEQLDMAEFESMKSAILSSGRMPNGTYSFNVIVKSSNTETGGFEISDQVQESIVITTPTSLTLIGPGGALADTSQNLVYSPYPIFQWETEPCPNCEAHIRLAEFDPTTHSSPQEAIEDVTILPLDQTAGWQPVGVSTMYQYPVMAPELIPGHIYVWQIKKDLPTTVGTESYISSIFAFVMVDATSPRGPEEEMLHPVLQHLMDILGEQQFKVYFGDTGNLEGFSPTGIYSLDGSNVGEDQVHSVFSEIADESATIITITIE
ncbi:MAG: hypothetical protein ACE5EE_09005 [Fidelibacterota bacterium]